MSSLLSNLINEKYIILKFKCEKVIVYHFSRREVYYKNHCNGSFHTKTSTLMNFLCETITFIELFLLNSVLSANFIIEKFMFMTFHIQKFILDFLSKRKVDFFYNYSYRNVHFCWHLLQKSSIFMAFLTENFIVVDLIYRKLHRR